MPRPASPPAVDGLPEALSLWPGYLLTFIAERTGERFEGALTADRIRTRHASVLAVIDAEGPMSQRALGRRVHIDKSAMVGILDDLERLGYAERRRDDGDRRVQRIHLTEQGGRALERALQVAEDENARTFRALDEQERAELHDLLLRIAETLAR